MNIVQFNNFMHNKDAELAEALKKEGKKLKFEDIINVIEFNDSSEEYRNFKDGQTFHLTTRFSYLSSISIDRTIMRVYGIHDIEVARFEDDRVTDYYNGLVDLIDKAWEDGKFDLPF